MKETNELILKFIGAKFSEPYWRIPKTGRWTEDKIQYHSSWDWLMPVIEKCAIGEGEFDQLKSEKLGEVYDKLLNFDLPGTHKAVVEFIKFCNIKIEHQRIEAFLSLTHKNK